MADVLSTLSSAEPEGASAAAREEGISSDWQVEWLRSWLMVVNSVVDLRE